MSATCPVCTRDCRNGANLDAHLASKHPEYPKPGKKKPTAKRTAPSRAEQQREWTARYSLQSSASVRDIAPLPAVADPDRRERCSKSLLDHCLTYYPAKFFLPFSCTHLKVIAKLERAVLKGGLFAVAMPRGSGKSELAKRAAEWAVLNGYRKFVVLLGATQELAEGLLADVQAQLESNDLLLADYPEACYPVRRLDRIVQRAKGQTFEGVPTRLEWSGSKIQLAQLPGSICGGAIIRAEGLTGAVRGMSAPGADGGTVRPDLVIPDDPQTSESARSISQVRVRYSLVMNDVLGLAGPQKSIACIMPCTVMAPNDLADQLLNRTTHPQWQGERSKLVDAFPKDEALWEEYFKIRNTDYGTDECKARKFYEANREKMDEGCVLSWSERFDPDAYASAIEEAMVYRREKPAAFAAEAQNEPLVDADIASGSLSAAVLVEKTNNQGRGIVPLGASRLTVGIDVGAKCLYWTMVAWNEDFGGAVVDYGAWPKQNRAYFTAADARPSLEDTYPGGDLNARIYAGLRDLTNHLLPRAYPREGGGEMLVDKCLIDSGYQTDTIYEFCRNSKNAVIAPSKGYGITASAPPMASWAWKPGQSGGAFWRLSPRTLSGRGRLILFDSNRFKSFATSRLMTPAGGRGSLYLPGGDNGHFIDHLVSEYRTTVEVSKQARKVDEWKLLPTATENHWLDALVMATVAACWGGLKWDDKLAAAVLPKPGGDPPGPPITPQPQKKRRFIDPAEAMRRAPDLRTNLQGGQWGGW